MRVLLWRLRACTGWRRRTTRRRRGWRRSCTAGMCCSRRSRARWPTSPSRSWRRGAAPTASPCPTRSARGQRGPAQEPRERLWMRREWSGRPGPPAGLPRALLQVGSSGSGTARLRVLCEKRFYRTLLRICVDWCVFPWLKTSFLFTNVTSIEFVTY